MGLAARLWQLRRRPLEGLIEQLRSAGVEVPGDVAAGDLVTNAFVDPALALPSAR